MLGQPNLEEIKDKLPSRYALVVVTARRARQILDKRRDQKSLDGDQTKSLPKPVTVALHEIAEEKVEVTSEGSGPLS